MRSRRCADRGIARMASGGPDLIMPVVIVDDPGGGDEPA